MVADNVTRLLACLLAPAVLAAVAHGETADSDHSAVDKSAFHLFNPTPSQYLRAMDTDGPGTTESPYTVDAGHVQVEMTFLAYTSERDPFDGERYELEAWAVAPMLLRLGLLNQFEAQVVVDPYVSVRERVGTNRVSLRGFGDTTLRLKYNFWGNDSGRTAFAVTPYLKFPTSSEGLGNNSLEGGLIFPLSVTLPDDVWLGTTTRLNVVRDWAGNGYEMEFANSIAVGHDLVGDLFGYLEFFSAVSTQRDASWVGTFNLGLIQRITDHVQLNGGVNLGVTRSADDWSAYFGMAWRF